MNETELKYIIEATLLAAGRPVTTQQILELFDERERPAEEALKAAFEALAADYTDRGIELVEVASGWRIQVRPRAAEIVSRLWQERPTRYSRALLETLALIAYRQPITRSEIEEIRGVAVSSTIMRTLQERNWIRTVGHREVPGRPELLGTTREFLDYFGLKSLDQLPTLAELKDVESIGVQLELPAGTTEGAQGEAAAAQGDAVANGDASNGGEGTSGESSANETVADATEQSDSATESSDTTEGAEAAADSATVNEEAVAEPQAEVAAEADGEAEAEAEAVVGDIEPTAASDVADEDADDGSDGAAAEVPQDADAQDAAADSVDDDEDETREAAGDEDEEAGEGDEKSTLVATADESVSVRDPNRDE